MLNTNKNTKAAPATTAPHSRQTHTQALCERSEMTTGVANIRSLIPRHSIIGLTKLLSADVPVPCSACAWTTACRSNGLYGVCARRRHLNGYPHWRSGGARQVLRCQRCGLAGLGLAQGKPCSQTAYAPAQHRSHPDRSDGPSFLALSSDVCLGPVLAGGDNRSSDLW